MFGLKHVDSKSSISYIGNRASFKDVQQGSAVSRYLECYISEKKQNQSLCRVFCCLWWRVVFCKGWNLQGQLTQTLCCSLWGSSLTVSVWWLESVEVSSLPNVFLSRESWTAIVLCPLPAHCSNWCDFSGAVVGGQSNSASMRQTRLILVLLWGWTGPFVIALWTFSPPFSSR